MTKPTPHPTTSSAPAVPPALEGLLCYSVYATGLALNRAYKPLLDKLGLTYPQYLVMLLLQGGPQTMGQLAQSLSLESNTLTPLVKRLEAAGFVTRHRDTGDERVVRVALTDIGRARAGEAACVPETMLKAMGLSAEEIDTLSRALERVRENLTAHEGA
ncbi:MarR family transcriptional regulator [Acuticoccus sediminis]|uniref:MarR family transcriptional regulator n=1 Tax=Acuticoccus sediminis TaxID=2184697 RepID=A0A8B2NZV7_9HYPH|nr:MarR family transcriptional regulator [Acuticoccus sediminis]RAI03234.1 MarR family transcriptional regulator [Acuticoccus sediminis]